MGVLAVFLLAACGATPPPPDPCDDPPRYGQDVLPELVEPKCLGCHSEGLRGPARRGAPAGVDFDTYALAAPHQAALVDAVTSGREPPPTLDPPVKTTEVEKQLVELWRACGYLP